jgi:hypothetical protein
MKMELLKNLELIDVQYTNENKKATLVFLDEERGEIREVNFNKQIYDNQKFVDDEEKAEKVNKWCADFFGLTFETLAQAIGERKDVFAYDNFNSLFEVSQVSKFDDDMVGQIFEVVVHEVLDDGKAIRIRFDYEDSTYESKMSYATFHEVRREWFVDPIKKVKQAEKFEKKFGFKVDDKEQLVGKVVMVEVKKAMGKWTYAEIKPFPKKKK